ncbi:MAG: hypothetical protein GQ574_04085 [Crocinitomix sp.]|nr:hypothetical protein [Crocinitomix sp.]
MQEVLILSKTHFGGLYCVGGIVIGTNQYVRLINAGNVYQPANTKFEVGQIWEIDFNNPKKVIEPHNEDVTIKKIGKRLSSKEPQHLAIHIQQMGVPVWVGSPRNLFNKLLKWTSKDKGFINDPSNLPTHSVGFWIPDQDLVKVIEDGKAYYRYSSKFIHYVFPYVGSVSAIDKIPKDTLIRVSLAKWKQWPAFEGQDQIEPRCYLQLSGWY